MRNRKIKKTIAIFISLVILTILPVQTYAAPSHLDTDGDDVPDMMDFDNDEELQEAAWSVFVCSDWTSKEVNLNFMLSDDGIAFVTNVDNYTSFIATFEKSLPRTIEELESEIDEGKTKLKTNPKYRVSCYTKIVSLILFDMLLGSNDNIITSWAEFVVTDNGNVLDDHAAFFKLNDTFKDWCLTYGGYSNEDEVKEYALWDQMSQMYFGQRATSFKDFVKIIIERITRFDGKAKYADTPDTTATYYFNPFKRYDMYSYVVLDSILDAAGNYDLSRSFFYTFLYSDESLESNGYGTYYSALKDSWDEGQYSDGYLGEDGISNWENYMMSFRNIYYYQNWKDDINFIEYTSDDTKTFVYRSYEDVDASYNDFPGAWNNTGNSFGQSYYDNYVAVEIKNHSVNGATGQVIE